MINTNLKKLFFLKAFSLITAAVSSFSTAQQAFALSPPGPFTIRDGKLVDYVGKPFIFRGVTVEQNRAPEKALQAIKDAAALGANAVQVEINGNLYARERMITADQLRTIIETCKASKVICVLEPNDVAGYPDAPGAGIPATAASFWTWPDIRPAIEGQQPYIILGFGNQYLGSMPASEYTARLDTYLADFSTYPLNSFVIMVDGSGWGQDADKAMYEFAKSRANYPSISSHILYSVDMFDAYTDPEKVRTYIESFSAIKAPLVIGGFAPTAYYHPHNIGPRPAVVYDLPEDSVMQYAEQYGVGYFGWSWSGNSNSTLDIVTNYNPNALTNWGNLLFNGANGIKATAKVATVHDYGSSSSSSSSTSSVSSNSSSSTPANRPPIADFTVSNYPSIFCGSPNAGQGRVRAEAAGSSDPDGDPLTYFWSFSGGGTASGYTATFTSRSGQSYQLQLTVTDSHGASASLTRDVAVFYLDCPFSSASSSSSSRSSQSSVSSSYISSSTSSSRSSISSTSSSRVSSSSSVSSIGKAQCSYQIQSQWSNGFTAAIRIKNVSTQPISGWSVNWKYADTSKVTNSWNANLSGNNPYTATNINWNSTIQPGQTLEFGFQGSKPAGVTAALPSVTGAICQ